MPEILHTPECWRLLDQWRAAPHLPDHAEYQLAEFVATHTDPEARDFLITVFDEDHGTGLDLCARDLWPLLTAGVRDCPFCRGEGCEHCGGGHVDDRELRAGVTR